MGAGPAPPVKKMAGPALLPRTGELLVCPTANLGTIAPVEADQGWRAVSASPMQRTAPLITGRSLWTDAASAMASGVHRWSSTGWLTSSASGQNAMAARRIDAKHVQGFVRGEACEFQQPQPQRHGRHLRQRQVENRRSGHLDVLQFAARALGVSDVVDRTFEPNGLHFRFGSAFPSQMPLDGLARYFRPPWLSLGVLRESRFDVARDPDVEQLAHGVVQAV